MEKGVLSWRFEREQCFFSTAKEWKKTEKYMKEVSFDLVELFISFLFIK